ncbi:MAG TPA: hypothetical protein VGL95_04070 [Acetobacteraceae bacterium]
MPATSRPGQTIRRPASAGTRGESIDRHVTAALAELRLSGVVTGTRSQRISVRVDPGVMRAAGARLGLTNPSDVVNASLAVAAAPDRFKAWWAETHATLPDDFEPAI